MFLEINAVQNKYLRRTLLISITPLVLLAFVGITIPLSVKESCKHVQKLKMLKAMLDCEFKLLVEDIKEVWK